jgi:hypothetical protein
VDSLCGQICLDPGDYTLSVHAVRGQVSSAESNVLDVDLTSTTLCTPVAVVQGPPAKPSKAATAGGVAAVVGALAAKFGQGAVPGLPSLPNLGCVHWKPLGPCLCNPYTPCVTVEYFEPAWIIETVKIPGSTALDAFSPVLQTVLAAAGVPALGGGGAGNANGSGHTNLHFSEAHIYAFPQLLGGPCTSCAPSTAPFAVHYASEIDPLWRTAVAVPSPLDLVRQVGVWGHLFPRGGKVIHGSEPVASGLEAARALDIAFNPFGEPPNVEARVVLQPTGGTSSCFQMAYPKQTGCFPAGTPPPVWEGGALSMRGTYIWIIWSKKTCCVNPEQSRCGIALAGGYGPNLCLLPPIP